MYKMLILAVLALGAMGAGTETTPSVDAAKATYASARAAALEKLATAPAYKAAVALRDARKADLQTARSDGTAEERLAASAAFVKADQAVKKLEAASLEADPDTIAAKHALDDANAAAVAAQKEAKQSADEAQRAAVRAKTEKPVPAPAPMALNEKVVAFCTQAMGKQIGDGECSTLAEAALTDAGIEWQKLADAPNKGDYVWGKLVCVIEKTGDADASAKDILPGDIIQLRDALIEIQDANSVHGIKTPHHTMIVKEFRKSTGDLIVYEQNSDGRRSVAEGHYHIPSLKSGWMRVYRPAAG